MIRLALMAALASISLTAFGQEDSEEKEEEAEDASRGRFLVLPVIITEPAIGEGLGIGLVYFHGDDDGAERPKFSSPEQLARTNEKQTPPPTATGIFGFYTSNETAGVAFGHSRTFDDDSWRLLGALARARINAKYYLADIPFKFSLDGAMLFGNIKNRIRETPWFIGASFSIADAKAEFDIGETDPVRSVLPDFSFKDVGIGAIGIFDTRNDTMMPETGQLFDLTVWRHDEAIGGDFSYTTARFKANSFHTFTEKFVLGLRFEVGTAGGDVPFYAEPFVPLRGIPALRFQGEVAGVFEVEGRYQFATRWAALAFAGSGFVREGNVPVSTDQDIRAWGVGIRFLALKKQNVWLGLDLARGPEEDAYYIQMTHPW